MPDSGEPLYDVFLSYSHKDRDVFGMEYIERIKEEIEKSLETIITDHNGAEKHLCPKCRSAQKSWYYGG